MVREGQNQRDSSDKRKEKATQRKTTTLLKVSVAVDACSTGEAHHSEPVCKDERDLLA